MEIQQVRDHWREEEIRQRWVRERGSEWSRTATFRTQALAPFNPFLLLLPFFSITMPDSKSTFHPALAVSNIKNHVPIILEMENVQYATWAELFKIHARSHRVIDHIIPPQDGKQKAPPTEEETELWLTLDATVL
ncbi:hypothetical protein D0Y65_006194 [Glycine soja]|uniref:Uncharacterized protein n=1 Tax=Glycine soja TaxID=3848 RepID=A0A445L7R0_GLYSO|nr:hypothetical protein D0Y65_006194 [Glycine soja]